MSEMLNKKDVLDAIEKKMKVVNEADGDADVVLGLAAAMSVVKKMKGTQAGWISVTDRLPDPEGCERYLVTVAHFHPDYKGRLVMVSEYETRFDDVPPFWDGSVDKDGTRVVAWMPLPKPYEGGEQNGSDN